MHCSIRCLVVLATALAASICLVTGIAAGVPAAAQQAEALLYQENFDRGTAPGWQLEPGWRVSEGALYGEGHSFARLVDQAWRDFRLQFRVRVVRGDVHLNYRYNARNRYFLGYHQGQIYLSKESAPMTFVNNLARGTSRLDPSAWHQFEIVGQGGRLQVKVDGKLEFDYTDPQPITLGSISFETLDGSAAYVDDVVVYGPPPDPRFTWVRTGGPPGGIGYDVRMRSDNPDVMYVTDAFAGIFVSTDGGQNWLPSNEGIGARGGETGEAIPVFSVTLDPHNQDILWIGMQNLRGIYKSTDGGRTWTEKVNGIAEKNGISFRGFTVDPRSSDIVYAAAEISPWEWAGGDRKGHEFDITKGVVYKTTDGGEHWNAVWRGDNLARYIWINPQNPDVVYVSTGIFDREAANSDAASWTAGGVGILKSTDGGQNWTQVNNGLGNLYIGSLFMHPTDPDTLLAGAANNAGLDIDRGNPYVRGSGVYLSTDGGASWQQTHGDDLINSVEFATSDPSIAYAAGPGGAFRSEDGGRTWRHMTEGHGLATVGFRAGSPIDLQVDPRDPNRLFANNYGGGNLLSVDGGRTWTNASRGYSGAQVRDVTVDPTAAGRVYASARSGLFASQNGGDDWVGISYPSMPGDEFYTLVIDPADPSHLLAASGQAQVALQASRDGGQTWQQVAPAPVRRVTWRSLAFAPSDSSFAYAGTGTYFSVATFQDESPAMGIYGSRDGGNSWSPANDALSADAHVASLAVDPHAPQRVYAATTNHGILRTTDGGQSWAEINAGLPRSPRAWSIAVHPADPRIVYAGLDRGGLYRSEDGGETWHLVAAGLNPEASVSRLVFDRTNPNVMYVADKRSGVYYSTDAGATWQPINDGLRNRAVNSVALSADGQHLYAATEGAGVFRMDLGGERPAGS